MPLNVLIVPDKFKGTLTAEDAAMAIARGWRVARPGDTLELLPMSDGGDGFGAVMSGLLEARAQSITTKDAAGRRCRATWWWAAKSRTAIIESANVVGLAQLPPKQFHPFALDTFGLGAVIRAAAKRGAKRCFIGIGGSATNDGGFGVARALGWKFLDGAGKPIVKWTELARLAKVVRPKRARWFEELIVAVDVQNLLLGARGCSRVYGPQKGLRPEDFALAEKCLQWLAVVVSRGKWNGGKAGDGAAGGLGFGLRVFLGARLEPGFDLFARRAKLAQRLRGVGLVITGEGAIDVSTAMGKGVGEIAARCRELKIPCLGLAGTVMGAPKGNLFTAVHGLTELATAEKARADAAGWLEKLAEILSERWKKD
jgi:glycerate kinase